MKVRKRLIGTLALSLLGFSVCIWYAATWAAQPTTQHVALPSGYSQPDEKSEQTISEALFQVNIPSDYRVETTPHQQPLVSTQIVAYSPATNDTQIGITAGLLPTDDLAGLATYNYRLKTPDRYSQISDTPVTFLANDSTELTVFLIDSQRYASLAVTSTSGDRQKLENISADLLKTWRWQP